MSQYTNSLAGEYFVAAELLRRGYNASIVVGNAKAIDIVVANADNTKSILIQVKTTHRGHDKTGKIYWMLNKKAETAQGNLYYVLVSLRRNHERPLFYILHSSIVAKYVEEGDRQYHTGTKPDGTPRKKTSIRMFDLFDNDNLDRWDVLGLD